MSVSAAPSVVQLADMDGDCDLALLTSALNLGLGGKRVDSVVGVGMQGFEYVATGGKQAQLRAGQGVYCRANSPSSSLAPVLLCTRPRRASEGEQIIDEAVHYNCPFAHGQLGLKGSNTSNLASSR